MPHRSKKPQTRVGVWRAVRRLLDATRADEMKGAGHPEDIPVTELELTSADQALVTKLAALFAERDELVRVLREVVGHYESLINSDYPHSYLERARAEELAPVLALLGKYRVKP